MKYKAILFHPDGGYVSDFKSETINEVWNKINNMGSRWIFYPMPFVGTEKTIVDTPEGLEFLKRKEIKTVQKYFEEQWKEKLTEIIVGFKEGLPLDLIYFM